MNLYHLAPFQKLKCSEDVNANGGDANGPFGVGREIEPGRDEQQDA